MVVLYRVKMFYYQSLIIGMIIINGYRLCRITFIICTRAVNFSVMNSAECFSNVINPI